MQRYEALVRCAEGVQVVEMEAKSSKQAAIRGISAYYDTVVSEEVKVHEIGEEGVLTYRVKVDLVDSNP